MNPSQPLILVDLVGHPAPFTQSSRQLFLTYTFLVFAPNLSLFQALHSLDASRLFWLKATPAGTAPMSPTLVTL
jgi:hypothetical protein